jgi:hypothetical protein
MLVMTSGTAQRELLPIVGTFLEFPAQRGFR